jgi:hypothetical protein
MKAAIWKVQSRVQSFHEWKNRVNPSATASPDTTILKSYVYDETYIAGNYDENC